jgi:uncharacterized protein YndB with AHSA1/START domain
MSSPSSNVVTVERTIPATPAAIFALISDPSRHHEFDGSGTVRDAKNVPDHLKLGSRFGMSMKLYIPYAMVSTVVEYEQDRLLAWQTLPPVPIVDKVSGGRIWRYELEPVDGGTLVRESWDISKEGLLTKLVVRRAAAVTRKNMAKTLERIEQVLA